jgi:hypothetical protein
MNMPKEHSKPADWAARSYVVHRAYGGQYIVKTSHWRVGYTPMYWPPYAPRTPGPSWTCR